MSRKYYCSSCGIELIHSRRAVPGKGHILDLIDPHECEGFAIKKNNLGEKTVVEILNDLRELGRTKRVGDREATGDEQPSHFGPGDRRKDVVTSTAPPTLLKNIRGLPTSDEEDPELED